MEGKLFAQKQGTKHENAAFRPLVLHTNIFREALRDFNKKMDFALKLIEINEIEVL